MNQPQIIVYPDEISARAASEARAILLWLVDGAKRWAEAAGHVEPLPELRIKK